MRQHLAEFIDGADRCADAKVRPNVPDPVDRFANVVGDGLAAVRTPA